MALEAKAGDMFVQWDCRKWGENLGLILEMLPGLRRREFGITIQNPWDPIDQVFLVCPPLWAEGAWPGESPLLPLLEVMPVSCPWPPGVRGNKSQAPLSGDRTDITMQFTLHCTQGQAEARFHHTHSRQDPDSLHCIFSWEQSPVSHVHKSYTRALLLQS